MVNKHFILSALLLTVTATNYTTPPSHPTAGPSSVSFGSQTTVDPEAIATRIIYFRKPPLTKIEKMQFIFALIAATKTVYDYASIIKKCLLPSQEDKLTRLTLEKTLKIIIAKDSFNESLLAHKAEPKNACGIPFSCEDEAEHFAREAGIDELNKMIKEFKETYGRCC